MVYFIEHRSEHLHLISFVEAPNLALILEDPKPELSVTLYIYSKLGRYSHTINWLSFTMSIGFFLNRAS